MKRLFTLFAAMLLAVCVWAQDCPKKISYQAVVRNSANQLVTNATGITVKVEILEGDAVKYSETHTGVTSNQNGLISLMIGENGTSVTGDMDDITNWPNDTIRTTITLPDGGGVVSAKSPVSAVPYALYACDINPDGPALKKIYKYINDTLNAYYDTTKINDTLKSYLTIDGLCDSIKNKCGDFATKKDVQNAVDTLVSKSTLNNYYTKSETYSQSEINTKFDGYYTKTKINDTLKDYLTISGLCDSIKNNCDDFATKTDVQNAVDTLVSKSTLKNYYTKSETYSQSEINTKFDGYYTKTKINDTLKSYLTIDGLCDSIKSKCGDFATKTELKEAVDTLVSKPTLINYYTKSETYSQSEINTKFDGYYTKTKINDTLKNYAVISMEKALTIKSITNADSTKLLNDTTLTIPTGYELDTDHLIKLYINGVYVGDNSDGVLVLTDKKVKYVPAANDDYKLAVDDRIKIIYWVKKN